MITDYATLQEAMTDYSDRSDVAGKVPLFIA